MLEVLEVEGAMYDYVPPSFQHEGTIGESESNLSEPDPESAGDHVRTRVEDQGLNKTKNHLHVISKIYHNIFLKLNSAKKSLK